MKFLVAALGLIGAAGLAEAQSLSGRGAGSDAAYVKLSNSLGTHEMRLKALEDEVARLRAELNAMKPLKNLLGQSCGTLAINAAGQLSCGAYGGAWDGGTDGASAAGSNSDGSETGGGESGSDGSN